jgi:predicted RNase H-like HicB family nuclease
MELENCFYGALVGLEGIAVAGDGVDDALEEP